jgi:hypothetical protein
VRGLRVRCDERAVDGDLQVVELRVQERGLHKKYIIFARRIPAYCDIDVAQRQCNEVRGVRTVIGQRLNPEVQDRVEVRDSALLPVFSNKAEVGLCFIARVLSPSSYHQSLKYAR